MSNASFSSRLRLTILLAATALAAGSPAWANMILGMPLIAHWLNFLGFIPVVIVEVLVAGLVAKRLNLRLESPAIASSFLVANLLSFMAGIFLAFLLEGGLMFVEDLPHEGFLNVLLWEIHSPGEYLGLVSDLAMFLAILLLFFPTWMIENAVIKVFLNIERGPALRMAFWSNAISYLLILLSIKSATLLS